MAYLASAAATLGEAWQLAQRYYALEDTDLLFQFDFEGDHPVISLGSRVYAAGHGARCQLTKSLIKSREGSAQVAFMLDFADQAALSVAFKRWTGRTPSEFRAAA